MNKEKVSQRKKQVQEKQRKATVRRNMLLGASTLAAVLVVAFLVFNAFQTIGEPVPVSMERLAHIPEGSALPQYLTNPPTGGKHYPSTFPAKFYEESELAGLPANPAGYLVHNLEHGYVIIWYNCQNLDAPACIELKTKIKDVMAQVNGTKVIAFPWTDMPENVVLTSWNRIDRMDHFSPSEALKFIKQYRNKSPEPGTP